MPRLRYNVNVRVEKIDVSGPDDRMLERAARLIIKGEVLVCPTDTGYAFSVNALNTRAVARVFNLKGRSYSNPIHVAVSSIEEAAKYAHVNKAARHLARHFLPGALTLVLPKKEIIPAMLVAGQDTIGIRIPDNKVILSLAEMVGRPLTTTSANISGQLTPYAVGEGLAHLGEGI
jgi:L-threonylcarbamoyladenylate synthase